jgi:hypothetical protein
MCPALTYETESARVELDRNINKDFAAMLLEIAAYLDAKVIIDSRKDFVSVEQL